MSSPGYDFWLFDLDGTVVDVDPSYPREVVAAVGDRLGREFTDSQAETLWYGVGGAREALLDSVGVDPEAFWDAFHSVEDPAARARATYVYDDAERVVPALDGPTGLVTHCQPFLTNPVLDMLDIRDWFDAVVCCTDETGWKPDPAPVEDVMADLGVADDREGVLVGDDPADVGAAWNAGLDAAHVRRVDPGARGQCVLGDHRVDRLDELRL